MVNPSIFCFLYPPPSLPIPSPPSVKKRPNPEASTPWLQQHHTAPCRHYPDLSSAADEWRLTAPQNTSLQVPTQLSPLSPPLHSTESCTKTPFTLPEPPSAPPCRRAALPLPTRGTTNRFLAGDGASRRRGRMEEDLCRLFLLRTWIQMRFSAPLSTAFTSCPPAATKQTLSSP